MKQDLFGRVRLGYVLVESRRRDAWRQFGHEGLGLHVDELDSGVLAFRLDTHERRIIVHPGDAEDVVAIGFQVDDEDALAEIAARLRARQVSVTQGSAEEARLRGVHAFSAFEGPRRQVMELFTRPRLSEQPLQQKGGGFVAGASGLGHLAILSQAPEAFEAFWMDIFDARLSDRIEDQIGKQVMDFAFLRLNERHHSIAIASTRGKRMNPIRASVHHFAIEAARFEDVVGAYRRCRKQGWEIANAIGQHPNDKEMSFYVVTPSGFEMELGFDQMRVEEAHWQPSVHQGISLWGHFKENRSKTGELKQMWRAIRSLGHKEYTIGQAPGTQGGK